MQKKTRDLLIWLNVAAFIVTLIINSLAGSTTLIGGRNTAQVSNLYQSLITPPGYVFAVWGVIYALLAAFIVFQTLPSQRRSAFHARIGWLFAAGSALNVAWLFVWQNGMILLSLVPIVLLLMTLAAIYFRLTAGRAKKTLRERLAVDLPFGVYFGWLSIATIGNIAAALVSLGYSGSGTNAVILTVLAALIVSIVSLFLIFWKKEIGYPLVAIWALSGIALNTGQSQTVMIAGIAVCVVIACALGFIAIRKKTR